MSTSEEKRETDRRFFGFNAVPMRIEGAAAESESIPYTAVDISPSGLGIISNTELKADSMVDIWVANGQLKLKVVWCKQDKVKSELFHVGLKCLDEKTDLVKVYKEARLAHLTSLESQVQENSEKFLRADAVHNILKHVDEPDQGLLKNAGLELLTKNHNGYPVVIKNNSYVAVAPKHLTTDVLHSQEIVGSKHDLVIYYLTPSQDGSKLNWIKVWPNPRIQQAASKGTVLVVDDDPDIVKIIEDILVEDGIYVVKAYDGKEGFLKGTTTPNLDLVVTDLKMPKLDGLEMLEKTGVINSVKKKFLPAIVITGHATKEEIEFGNSVGVDHWLIKPFEPSDLLAQVKKLLPSRVKKSA